MRAHRLGGSRRFAFSGLMKCGVCGSTWWWLAARMNIELTDVPATRMGARRCVTMPSPCVKTLSRPGFWHPSRRIYCRLRSGAHSPPGGSENYRKEQDFRQRGPRYALRQQIGNLVDAIASGALKASPALAERLSAAEDELGTLTAQTTRASGKIVDFPSSLATRFNKLVERLEEYLSREPDRARAALREICGEIHVFPHESGKYLVAKLGLSDMFLRAAVGSERSLVAGVGFETYDLRVMSPTSCQTAPPRTGEPTIVPTKPSNARGSWPAVGPTINEPLGSAR